MKTKAFLMAMALLCLGATAFGQSELVKRSQTLFKPIPATPPVLPNNQVTTAKVELGKMLYFEPRLSKSGLISCNTCHNIGLGGADYQETSVGHRWQKGARNAPTVLNAVFNLAQFWDGRAADLKEQAMGPLQALVEMGNTPEQIMQTLGSMPAYVDLFKKAFSGQTDPLTFDNMVKAIEAFEATLLTPGSRFDKYLEGQEAALSKTEQEGLKLFMDKGCSSCHGGINLGGAGYYPFGLVEKPKEEITAGDLGRFQFTGVQSDQYVVKSPSLRNIDLTLPYFHSGKIWSLYSAVAVMGSAQLGITLSEGETLKIVEFLKTATGDQPRVEYPILPAPTKDTPRPQLD